MASVPDKLKDLIHNLNNDFTGKTIVLSVPSILGSIIYAALTAWAAAISRSLWLGFMTAFYVVTVLMSISVLGSAGISAVYHGKRFTRANNYKRFCIRMIIFDILFGLTILYFHFHGIHRDYPGYTIYLTALYVFIKVYFAVVNMYRAHKTKSYTTIALRQINAIKALVSLLILQNALLSRFGNPNTDFTRNFNSVSGAFAFLFILLMSTYGLIVVMKERT